MTPDDRKYTESHEWVLLDGDVAVVGITQHAQESLGDMTFVDPSPAGTEVEQGEECAVLESVKAASELYAPVAGVIVEANPDLESAPELVNEDPYGAGWILKLKNINTEELESLMDASAYEAHLG